MENSNLNNELIIYLKEKIKMINEDLLIVKISDDNNVHYILREFSKIVYNFQDNLCESFTAKFKKNENFYTLKPYDIFNEVSGYNSYQENYTFTCFQSIRFNVKKLKIVKDFWIQIIIMFYQFRKRECNVSTTNLNRIVDNFENDTAKIINNFQRFTKFLKKKKKKKLKKATSESTKKTTSSVAEILLNLGESSNHHQLNDSVNKKSQTSLNSISSSDKSNKDLSQKVVRECLSYILDCVEKNNPQKSSVISRKDESICETKKKSKALTIDCTLDSNSSSLSAHSLIDLTHETQEKEKDNELIILQQEKGKSAVCQKSEDSASSSSKSWPKVVKIKVNENKLLRWTVLQNDGEVFQTEDVHQLGSDAKHKLQFLKQLLRIAVCAGQAKDDAQYTLRYVTSRYSKPSNIYDVDNIKDKMIAFAKSKDSQWVQAVCVWINGINFRKRELDEKKFKRAVHDFESSVGSGSAAASSSLKSLEVLSKKRKSLNEINSGETKKIKMVESNIIKLKKSVDLSRSMFIQLSKTSRDLKLSNQKISEQVDEISAKNTELETQISDREKVIKCQESFRKILDNKFSMIDGKTKNLSLFGNELVNNGSLQVCKMCKSVPSSETGYMVAIPCGHVDICKNCFSIAQPKHCIHDDCSCSFISYIRLNI